MENMYRQRSSYEETAGLRWSVPGESAEREFPYRPRWTTILLGGFFFAACALFLGYRAATNVRGLIIEGFIRLDPERARVFYGVLAALGAGFVIASCFLAVHRLTFEQRLTFGPTAMTVPASRWSRTTKQIAYRDIRQLSIATVSGQTFLHVHHVGGKFTVVASMLPSREAFDEVQALIARSSASARGVA
jgi:hypothetical protein